MSTKKGPIVIAVTTVVALIGMCGVGLLTIPGTMLGILALDFLRSEDSGPFGDFPENPGYLRATDGEFGKLTIFDADTFKIYRTVDVPRALEGDSHRLERDDRGRVWIGYSQEYTGVLWNKEEVRVFSEEGEVEHVIDTQCGPPEGGIAFANGYAFIGCVSSGFTAKVVIVDTETIDIVKTLEVERPHPEIPDFSDFFASAVEEVAGSILVLGRGVPPLGYDEVKLSTSGVTIVARIDPDTLTVDDYKAEFAPGSKILDAVEVDGMAWLLNSFSHIPERPSRTDIYVIDPVTLDIVDSFNLPKPYPVWGKIGADGYVYIYHQDLSDEQFRRRGGVTRIDPVTREMEYTKINGPERGSNASGFGVYRGRPCMVLRSGLWCMNDDGRIDLNLSQKSSIGVLFSPTKEE